MRSLARKVPDSAGSQSNSPALASRLRRCSAGSGTGTAATSRWVYSVCGLRRLIPRAHSSPQPQVSTDACTDTSGVVGCRRTPTGPLPAPRPPRVARWWPPDSSGGAKGCRGRPQPLEQLRRPTRAASFAPRMILCTVAAQRRNPPPAAADSARSPDPGTQTRSAPAPVALSLAQPGDVPAEDFDQSRGRFLQRGHPAPDGRLTRTGLFHQAKGLAAVDAERDRVDRFKAAGNCTPRLSTSRTTSVCSSVGWCSGLPCRWAPPPAACV